MAYVEWHGTIPNHFKTKRLARLLACKKVEAVGYLGCLVAWAIENRPGGSFDRDLLPEACEYEGDDSKGFIKAMIEVGWVDEIDGEILQIHDWHEVTSGYRKARRDAKNAKKKRVQEAKKRATEAQQSRDESAVNVQNRTEQNEQRGTEQKETPGASAPSAPDVAKAITERLVNLWNTGRTSGRLARVTPKRISKVRARLKDGFEETDLVLVVKKLLESAWHQGQNENKWKAPGPEWVLASTEKVEEWICKEISNGRHNPAAVKVHGGQPSAFSLKPGDLGGGTQTA